MRKIIIAAVSKNGVIGKSNGEMSWHIKEEFQHFKNTTLGSPIIMGRKTFQSLGKPLKGRLNIVLTRNKDINLGFDEVKVFDKLNDAYGFCENQNVEKIFIIGGGEIYKKAVSAADEMIISYINFEADGDVYFPSFNVDEWTVEKREKHEQFEIFYYVRKKNVS